MDGNKLQSKTMIALTSFMSGTLKKELQLLDSKNSLILTFLV